MIIIPYPYDTAQHDIQELPVTPFLRRETGVDNLVTYRHRITGNWVVSLQGNGPDGVPLLVDIDILSPAPASSNDHSAPDILPEVVRSIIHKLKTYITVHEAAKRTREHRRAELEKDDKAQSRRFAALRDIYLRIKRRFGPLAAERWQQCMGAGACGVAEDPGMPQY